MAKKLLNNTKLLQNGEILKWSKVKQFRFEKKNLGRVYIKYDLDHKEYLVLKTDRENRRSGETNENMPIGKLARCIAA